MKFGVLSELPGIKYDGDCYGLKSPLNGIPARPVA